MKKTITILTAVCLLVCGLTACGGEETPPAPNVVSIEVVGASATVEAGTFDPADYRIKATMDDGTSQTLAMTSAMLKAEEVSALSEPGSHTLTVSYGGCTVQFPVTVTEKTVPKDPLSLNLILFWQEDVGVLRLALVGPLGDGFRETAFAGFEISLTYRGNFEGVAAGLDGLKTKREDGVLKLYWAEASDRTSATEIARLGFSENSFSASSAEIRVFDENQEPIECAVYFGNDYWEDAGL